MDEKRVLFDQGRDVEWGWEVEFDGESGVSHVLSLPCEVQLGYIKSFLLMSILGWNDVNLKQRRINHRLIQLYHWGIELHYHLASSAYWIYSTCNILNFSLCLFYLFWNRDVVLNIYFFLIYLWLYRSILFLLTFRAYLYWKFILWGCLIWVSQHKLDELRSNHFRGDVFRERLDDNRYFPTFQVDIYLEIFLYFFHWVTNCHCYIVHVYVRKFRKGNVLSHVSHWNC